MNAKELLVEIFKLEPEEQLKIAELVECNLRNLGSPEGEEEFRRELDRRLEEADRHPEKMVPHDEVMKILRSH